MKNTALFGTLAALALGASTALAECPPSIWGADDTIGSASLVTPERTLEASKLIKQGKSLPLGITIGADTPAFPPRSLSLQVVQPNQQGGQKLSGFGYDHPLALYGSAGPSAVSDMNGDATGRAVNWWLRLYWGGVALAMAVLAHLLWRRGTETRLVPR